MDSKIGRNTKDEKERKKISREEKEREERKRKGTKRLLFHHPFIGDKSLGTKPTTFHYPSASIFFPRWTSAG